MTMLLSACSSDESGAQTVTTGEETPVGKLVQLMLYTSHFQDYRANHRAAPSGFTAYTPDKTTDMGIYMIKDGDLSYKEERLRYASKWFAFFEAEAQKNYTVYGYMPKITGMSSSLSSVTPDGATLTINGIKPVTTDDICIITGVKETDEGLKEGQFSWNTPTTGNQTFYINILMDHLYAAAQFRLKIDAEYAALRTIKLKTMTLRTDYGSVNAAITLAHNDTGASPITGVTYTPSGDSDEIIIFNRDEGVALDKTTLLTINSYFVPTLSDNLTLVSTYDVYDSKGNLIRQNCTATNKLPNLNAVRGQRVLLYMTVNPTYLYVLSDPDLDNPTIKIEN
jgi:hypothetical protein